jgi:hypothetical protein
MKQPKDTKAGKWVKVFHKKGKKMRAQESPSPANKVCHIYGKIQSTKYGESIEVFHNTREGEDN